MDYKIVEKEAITVLGKSKIFKYDSAYKELPKFWDEHCKTIKNSIICGNYGIIIDKNVDKGEFEYLIADKYVPGSNIPKGAITKVIPKHTWAVFPCMGPLVKSIKELHTMIYSKLLPSCKDYEVDGGYFIELYSDPLEYINGNQNKNYYSEIWISVKKK